MKERHRRGWERRLGYLQRNRCYLCGRPLLWRHNSHPLEDRWWATVDHILPRSRGGLTEPSNTAMAHKGCNETKEARMPTACEVFYGLVNAVMREPKYMTGGANA